MVADRIRQQIILGDLSEGERLPRLEDLAEDFGVSPQPMREAMRILESEGLLSVQRGNRGGAVVHLPTHATAANTLAIVLASQGTTVLDLREALTIIEPGCAMLCARRTDRERTVVRTLEMINAAGRQHLDDEEKIFGKTMTDFHEALVRHCKNQTMVTVAGALESIFGGQLWGLPRSKQTDPAYKITRADRLSELEIHERVTDLIRNGDEAEVATLMSEHINTYAKRMASGGSLWRQRIDARLDVSH